MELEGLTPKQFETLLQSNHKKLFESLINIFSSVEKINHSFQIDKKTKCSATYSNTDVNQMQTLLNKFFEAKDQSTNKVIQQISILLTGIKGPEGFKAIVKKGEDLRFVLLILLIDEMFEFQQRDATLILAETISNISNQSRKALGKWLVPMSDKHLLQRVESIQTLLSIELLKLMPDEQQPDFPAVQKAILNLCKLLELMFATNYYKPRITNDHFLNSQITEHIDPLSQIKLSFKNKQGLNFTKFPFLLDLNYKSKLLELQYKIEQTMSLQQGIHNINNGFLGQVNLHGNLTLDKILFLHFEVRRDNLLEDSITQLSQTKASMKKPLKIAFTGQAGVDEGGVKAQYFQLITKQILNPNLGMFLPKHSNRLYWFNGNSFQPPINFEFVGTLLGLSIYNSILLDLPFPKIIYKKILARQGQVFNSLEDLNQIEPDIQDGLKKILQSDDLTTLQLSFQITTQSFGQIIYHDLKPNGSTITVTKQNRQEYVNLYADYLLNKHVQKQFNSFKKGFFKVVTGHMIKVFYPDELQKIICGDPVLDFKALQKSTQYQGYTAQSKVVKWFWNIVQNMDLQMKKAFLFFCTGCDRSPIKGLGSLGFVIQRQGPDTNNLPTAHTCNNVFMLPEYNSQQKLKQKLQLSIKNNVGFGLI